MITPRFQEAIMKRILWVLAVTIAVVAPNPATAQYGSLGVFGDAGGCDCDIDDVTPGLFTVYVVHRDIANGVEGSRFIVRPGAGTLLTYIGEASIGGPIIITGGIVEGYEVFYNMCATGGLAIMTVQFFGQGLSQPCSLVELVAAPSSVTGNVEIFDCSSDVHAVSTTPIFVNATNDCICRPGPCTPVPVEETTWGAIKSLYQ
jgi:hypothetical protein